MFSLWGEFLWGETLWGEFLQVTLLFFQELKWGDYSTGYL